MTRALAILVLLVGLAACGENEEADESVAAAPVATSEPAPTPTPTPTPEPVPTPEPKPGTYGSDPVLDRFYDECEDGIEASCDRLFWDSPVGSEYEQFASTRRNLDLTGLVEGDNTPELDAEIGDLAFRAVIADTFFPYEEAREVAQIVCDSLDDGMTLEEVQLMAAMAAMQEGLSEADVGDVGTVMGAGIVAFCPEHTP